MFVDEAIISVKGGRGGPGSISFYPMRSGPCGGNGGHGGNVYAEVNNNITDLKKYIEIPKFEAGNGGQGGSFLRVGAKGEDIVLKVPPNTTFIDTDTREEILLSLNNPRILLCRGGKGGLGNDAFKSPTNRTPRKAEPGTPGQKRNLRIILKLIADYGLIGLPNAGKSSLLNKLTAANVKTANYPFTTLEPNLGVVNNKVIADLPGLIEGAAHGKGLGIKFLKHIEKVTLLLHCISVESDDIDKDFQTVTKELANYNEVLTHKKVIILLTKTDLSDNQLTDKSISLLGKYEKQIIPISIYDQSSLDKLKEIL